jgi:hypothetical protein
MQRRIFTLSTAVMIASACIPSTGLQMVWVTRFLSNTKVAYMTTAASLEASQALILQRNTTMATLKHGPLRT